MRHLLNEKKKKMMMMLMIMTSQSLVMTLLNDEFIYHIFDIFRMITLNFTYFEGKFEFYAIFLCSPACPSSRVNCTTTLPLVVSDMLCHWLPLLLVSKSVHQCCALSDMLLPGDQLLDNTMTTINFFTFVEL